MKKLALSSFVALSIFGWSGFCVLPNVVVILATLIFAKAAWALILTFMALAGGVVGQFLVDDRFWRLIIAAGAL